MYKMIIIVTRLFDGLLVILCIYLIIYFISEIGVAVGILGGFVRHDCGARRESRNFRSGGVREHTHTADSLVVLS